MRVIKHGPYWYCGIGHQTRKRRERIRMKYGITWQEWDTMLIAQSGRCAICTQPMQDPHLDHCHATGRVRGLLCRNCNHGLGQFRDDPALLRSAISYLTV